MRGLWKNKTSTLIILISLGTAIASSLLLFKYANYELSFDKFNKKADRIYRIPHIKYEMGALLMNQASNVSNLAPWLKENYPEIEDVVRVFAAKNEIIYRYQDKDGNFKTITNHENWVDPNFCNLFPMEFVYGNGKTAFARPFTINLSESLSKKMFGDENPLGKKINLYPADQKPYEIVGVYKDFPSNSHFNFDVLMSFKDFDNMPNGHDWVSTVTHTYVLLKEGASAADLQKKIDNSLKGELEKILAGALVKWLPEYKDYKELVNKRKFKYEFPLQPLTSLNFCFMDGEIRHDHKQMRVIIFMIAISVLILIIAWINFFNLSGNKMLEETANTQIRKVLGAGNRQIFFSFIVESLIINVCGFFIALIIYRSLFPYFIILSNLPPELNPFTFSYNGYSTLLIFLLFSAILFMISLIIPLILPFIKYFIQNKYFVSESTVPYRNIRSGVKSIMVVTQFVFSIFMITAIVTMYRQMNYMNRKELGFNPDQILVVKSPTYISENFYNNYQPFYDKIQKNPVIIDYSEATSVPPMQIPTIAVRRKANIDRLFFSCIFHNRNYLKYFDIEIVAGTNYITSSNFFDSLDKKVIINETASKQLGFNSPEEAIGKSLFYDRIAIYENLYQVFIVLPILRPRELFL